MAFQHKYVSPVSLETHTIWETPSIRKCDFQKASLICLSLWCPMGLVYHSTTSSWGTIPAHRIPSESALLSAIVFSLLPTPVRRKCQWYANCSVVGCKNQHKSLHIFPSSEAVKTQCLKFFWRKFGKLLYVCANRFNLDCFLYKSQYKTGFASKLKNEWMNETRLSVTQVQTCKLFCHFLCCFTLFCRLACWTYS